jgi:hypothetical protein
MEKEKKLYVNVLCNTQQTLKSEIKSNFEEEEIAS